MSGPYVDPIGSGLKPARIDMGVDYTGAGTLYAMGAGTIENVSNSGWPGGKFISLKLDEGPYAGKYVYYAENIKPSVSKGQHVSAGTPIGEAVGTYPYIEVGWAAAPGTGQALAAATGQAASSGDPGGVSTAYGVSMSNLIHSLGGPGGVLQTGGVKGNVAAGYPAGSGVSTDPSSTPGGSPLSGCVPLIWVVWIVVQFVKRLCSN